MCDIVKWTDEHSEPSLKDWAYILKQSERESLFEKLKEFHIKKEDWTINRSYDLLDNYIDYCFRKCYQEGRIFYYTEKEGRIMHSYKCDGGFVFPSGSPQYALFNLRLKDKVTGTYIFICFIQNDNGESPWKLYNFVTIGEYENSKSEKASWKYELEEVTKEDTQKIIEDREETSNLIKSILKKGNIKELLISLLNRHMVDDTDGKDRIKERFPKDIANCYDQLKGENKVTFANLLISLIRTNIELTFNADNFIVAWENKNKKEIYQPKSLLYPIYLYSNDDSPFAALLFKIHTHTLSLSFKTLLCLKYAYSKAMIVDPYFEQKWLTLEHIKKAERNKR